MLTIAPFKRWSIKYYNDTARGRGGWHRCSEANGGLGEYYSEGETRAPVWVCADDAADAATLAGLSDADRAGGQADLDVVARWLDDGIAPIGPCSRAFGRRDNHGFDLTFAAPKSVSLLASRMRRSARRRVRSSHSAITSSDRNRR